MAVSKREEEGCQHHPSHVILEENQEVHRGEGDYPPLHVGLEAHCSKCEQDLTLTYRYKRIDRE